MNINDMIHGFKVIRIRAISELKAEMYEMEHVKSGAKAIWLKRDDDNKTFSIAFKTTPDDDTGVFHILEHSVLNGSERFPLKEPFVDLLKSSLQTFLNAMTYPDKTVYPISSRNDKDFVNLMRVYLDAVFHPLAVTQPNTFRQEGWHFELNDENEEPIYKGVVFNEMKGAFSSPDSVRTRALMHALFPDNCYGNESGGDPDHITELTWEKFCQCHKRYYRPSNSYIFLDGDMGIESVLAIIDDEYLSHYDADGEYIDIKWQKPVVSEPVCLRYEISPDMDEKGKAQISYGYVIGRYDEYEKNTAFALLSNVLCGSNESPLKKAILSKGLAEDVSFYVENGIQQPYIEISIINTDLDKEPEITKTINDELRRLVKEGIDREELEATLNKAEFKARERDFGGAPKGLVFALSSLDSWLYGGDPVNGILNDAVYQPLREKIGTGYFEKLIEDELLNCPHTAKVMLQPDRTLGEEKARKEKEKLATIKASWDKQELSDIVQMNKEFAIWQSLEDTPEQKATLPVLKLSDLKEKPEDYDYEICHHHGETTVIKHHEETDGITYASVYSHVDDFELADVSRLSLLTTLLSYLPTERHETIKLRQLINRWLGDFDVAVVASRSVKTNEPSYYCCLNYSCLTRNDNEAIDLVREIMYQTRFDNKNAIREIVRQNKTLLEQTFSVSGSNMAAKRALAYSDEVGVFNEYSSGYEMFCYLRKLEEKWDEIADSELKRIEELYKMLFVKGRLLISIASSQQPVTVKGIVDKAPEGTCGPRSVKKPLGNLKEGIAVAANVSFAAKVSNITDLVRQFGGKSFVLGNILSYDYLWTNVRVKGGAYGCGFSCGSGIARFSSYRDPNPANTLKIFQDTDKYLEAFNPENGSVENYIIGAMGDYDPYLSNKALIKKGTIDYLTDSTYEVRCQLQKDLLSTTLADIKQMKVFFDEMNKRQNICVVGKREALEKCRDELNTIFNL